jgi:hypothetical protein
MTTAPITIGATVRMMIGAATDYQPVSKHAPAAVFAAGGLVLLLADPVPGAL